MGEICCKPEKTKKTVNDRDFHIDIPEDSKLKKLNQIKLEVNYCKNEEKIENISKKNENLNPNEETSKKLLDLKMEKSAENSTRQVKSTNNNSIIESNFDAIPIENNLIPNSENYSVIEKCSEEEIELSKEIKEIFSDEDIKKTSNFIKYFKEEKVEINFFPNSSRGNYNISQTSLEKFENKICLENELRQRLVKIISLLEFSSKNIIHKNELKVPFPEDLSEIYDKKIIGELVIKILKDLRGQFKIRRFYIDEITNEQVRSILAQTYFDEKENPFLLGNNNNKNINNKKEKDKDKNDKDNDNKDNDNKDNDNKDNDNNNKDNKKIPKNYIGINLMKLPNGSYLVYYLYARDYYLD